MEEDCQERQYENVQNNSNANRTSFKNMLQGSSSMQKNSTIGNSFNPLFDSQMEDEADSDDDQPPEEFIDDDKCPVILLTREEKKRIHKPWKSSLIIKMFDKNIGYMTLLRRLSKKWQLKGEFTLTDLGCSYYISRLSNMEDYHHVLTDGPWLIDDH